ncbi:unnamed protein product [Rotaria sp. Silwood2]|nr:unnamed protein product [Rotaria sp. Silwood2]
MIMIKQLVYKLFSSQCQLRSLRFDISNDFRDGSIHRCLVRNSYLCFKSIQYQHQSCCVTLRRLHIRLNRTCFLKNLVSHVPNLEKISVEFDSSLDSCVPWNSNVETLRQSKTNWFNKIPKLRYFLLKTFIYDDLEFLYLKWLLNNLNYVEKLRLHIKSDKLIETRCQNI